MKILHVVGSRSGFFRISPVYRALTAAGADRQVIVYAGHREELVPHDMFLEELELPSPDYVLGVSTGTSAFQTGRSLIALEPIVLREAPDWIFAVGDVDAALAAALVGRKNGIPLAHLEAGLRAGDRLSPVEINRLLADRLSDALFTAERETSEHLISEGIEAERVHFVGNTIADTVSRLRDRSSALELPAVMGLEEGSYIVALLQRTSDPQRPGHLEDFLEALDEVALETGRATIILLDSSAAADVRKQGLEHLLAPLTVVASTSYVELVALVEGAGAVVTNAREVQDCATVVGVPSVAVGDLVVGRAAIFKRGNHVSLDQLDRLPDMVSRVLTERPAPLQPELWDGHAAQRLAEITMADLPMAIA
jgi:UDP-N-acetylglucosamine 2-epimerase (non-hydrolysing)